MTGNRKTRSRRTRKRRTGASDEDDMSQDREQRIGGRGTRQQGTGDDETGG